MAQGKSKKIAIYSALTVSVVLVLVVAIVTAVVALPSPGTAVTVAASPESTSVEGLPEQVPAPAAPACDYADLIGKKAEAIDPARLGGHPMRILVPGAAVTMEYLEGRVNVHVDDHGMVTMVTCG